MVLAVVGAACADDELSKVFARVEITPTTIELGGTPVGVVARHEVTVENVGSVPLILEGASLVAPVSDDLASSPVTSPTEILVGEHATIEVLHVPRDDVLDRGTLRIMTNARGDPQIDVPIEHLAVGVPDVAAVGDVAIADVEADTPVGVQTRIVAVPFGVVPFGTSRVEQLHIINAGQGNLPLEVRRVALTSTNLQVKLTLEPDAGAFLGALGAASRTAMTRSARVRIEWTPSSAGDVLAETLRIETNDPDTPSLDIPLTAETMAGDPPVLRWAPAIIDFGDVGVMDTASAQIVAHNDGLGDLVIQPLTLSTNPGGVFSVTTPPAQRVVAPGGQQAFDLSFTPIAEATYEGALTLATNDPGRTPSVDVRVIGNGTDTSSCTPATPDPTEPSNDICTTARDRGLISLASGNGTERRTWQDAVVELQDDGDWSVVRVRVELGCSLVGYEFGARVTMMGSETGEVCVRVGDCTNPTRQQCMSAGSDISMRLFPAGQLCRDHNNEVPVYVQVKHTGGQLSCQPYSLQFSAR